jgi:hypothetical protein
VVIFIGLLMPTTSYAECNFRTSDYLASLATPKSIQLIDIKISKSAKFARNQFKIATSRTKNIPEKLKKKFKAQITVDYEFGTCRYHGIVRQSGDQKDHFKLLDGDAFTQSLDVRLKTGNILNAVNFKLLLPETRNGIDEIFATTLFRNIGFIAPETFEVNVSVNGVKGVMLFQEKARKELLERNHRREGPIFRGDEALIWGFENYEFIELERLSLASLYNKSWFKKGSSSRQMILGAYGILQNASLKSRFHQNGVGKQSYFIPDLLSETIYNDFMGVLFAMNGDHGLYLNNRRHYYNAIAGRFEPIYYDGNVNLSLDWRPPKTGSLQPVKVSEETLTKTQELTVNSRLKEKFLARIINQKQANVFYDNSLTTFRSNLAKIQSQNSSTEYVVKSSAIESQEKYISWYKDLQKSKNLDQKIVKNIRETGSVYQATLDDESVLVLNNEQILDIISKNNLNDDRFVYIPSSVDIAQEQGSEIKKIAVGSLKITISKGMSLTYNLQERRLEFYQSQPTDWALVHDSYINGWMISLNGMIAKSSKSLQEQRFNALGITGCVTIYNSELIDTSLAISNGQCEDSLNLINTTGKEIKININDSYADAVDADFSSLNIDSLEISNAGNDCFDVSGGKYYVTTAVLAGCGDKGISIGEKSSFEGDKISIENASIGISAKDYSQAFSRYLSVQNVVICGEAKKKKQEFGGGVLHIEGTNCSEKYLSDDMSTILLGN